MAANEPVRRVLFLKVLLGGEARADTLVTRAASPVSLLLSL